MSFHMKIDRDKLTTNFQRSPNSVIRKKFYFSTQFFSLVFQHISNSSFTTLYQARLSCWFYPFHHLLKNWTASLQNRCCRQAGICLLKSPFSLPLMEVCYGELWALIWSKVNKKTSKPRSIFLQSNKAPNCDFLNNTSKPYLLNVFRIKTKRRNVSKRVKIPHCRLGIVSYARLLRTFSSLVCLFVTQESRALFLLLFVCLFVCGVQISHDVSSLAFLLYTRISRIVRLWFVCYARISRTISSLVCLFVC